MAMGLFDFIRHGKKDKQHNALPESGSAENEKSYVDDFGALDMEELNLSDPYGLLDSYGSLDYKTLSELSDWLGDKYAGGSYEKWSGWGSGFGGSSTWRSTTYTVPMHKSCKPSPPDYEELARTVAGDEWKKALVECWFVQQIVSGLSQVWEIDTKASDWRVDALIWGCEATCLFSPPFPLDVESVGKAMLLVEKLCRNGMEVPTHFKGDEEVSEYREQLGGYASAVTDMQRIWVYASKQFAGHSGLCPAGQPDYVESFTSGERRSEDVFELSRLTSADVLFESYFAGVPVDDIVA